MSNIIDLSEVLQRELNARPKVFIERWPITANRTKVRLCSIAKASVQCEIDHITAQVESFGPGGEAHFKGPFKEDNIWKATGTIVVYPDV
jgi:hypothetical protein